MIALLDLIKRPGNVKAVPQGVQNVQALQLVRNVQITLSRMESPV